MFSAACIIKMGVIKKKLNEFELSTPRMGMAQYRRRGELSGL
jgi:hypothetical protein